MVENHDCAELHRKMRDCGASPSALAAEVGDCPACALLIEDEARLGMRLAAADAATGEPRLADLDAQFDALDAQLGEAQPLRELPTWIRGLALALLTGVLLAAVLVSFRRIDWALYPLPRLFASLSLLGVAGLVAASVILRPLHRPEVPRPFLALTASLAVLAPALVCSLPAAHGAHPASLFGTGDDLATRAIPCFVFGFALALILIGGVWVFDRRALRRPSDLLLTLLGAGAIGNALLVLHCPLVEPIHKLAGHASVSGALLIIAVVLVQVLGQRSRPMLGLTLR